MDINTFTHIHIHCSEMTVKKPPMPFLLSTQRGRKGGLKLLPVPQIRVIFIIIGTFPNQTNEGIIISS